MLRSLRRLESLPLAALALLVVYLLPVTRAVLRGDDAWISEARGHGALVGKNLIETLGAELEKVIVLDGRPQPLGVIQGNVVLWLFDDHSVLYRLFLIGLTAVAAWLLYRLALKLGASAVVGAALIVLVGAFIHVPDYHEPLTGYYGAVQFVLIAMLWSLLLFVDWLRDGRRGRLVWSLVLAACALAVYEVAYPLVFLHLGVALIERRGRAAVLAAAPFLALGVLWTGLAALLRRGAEQPVTGYEVGFAPVEALRTYVIQLFPPLPASQLVFDPSNAGGITPAELLGATWRGAVVAAVVLALGITFGRDSRVRFDRLPAGALAGVGALLYLLPTILIAAAAKYQAELTPGKGYLPALIQSFGFGCLLTAGLAVAYRAAARRSRTALLVTSAVAAGVLGMGAAFTAYGNLRVIALGQPARETRDLLERSVERGVTRFMPAGSTLLYHERDMAWPTGNWRANLQPPEEMVLRRTGRLIDARILPPPESFPCGTHAASECARLPREVAWIRTRAYDGGGTVIVAPMQGDANARPFAVPARELVVYAESRDGAPEQPLVHAEDARGKPWTSREARWTRVDGGDGWTLFRGTLPGRRPLAWSVTDPRSKVDFLALPPPRDRVRLFGTDQLLP